MCDPPRDRHSTGRSVVALRTPLGAQESGLSHRRQRTQRRFASVPPTQGSGTLRARNSRGDEGSAHSPSSSWPSSCSGLNGHSWKELQRFSGSNVRPHRSRQRLLEPYSTSTRTTAVAPSTATRSLIIVNLSPAPVRARSQNCLSEESPCTGAAHGDGEYETLLGEELGEGVRARTAPGPLIASDPAPHPVAICHRVILPRHARFDAGPAIRDSRRNGEPEAGVSGHRRRRASERWVACTTRPDPASRSADKALGRALQLISPHIDVSLTWRGLARHAPLVGLAPLLTAPVASRARRAKTQ